MTQRRRRVGPAALAVAALVLISIPLAAPGLALVPGAANGAPGWLRGIYGDGFGLSPETYLALLYVAVAIWVVTFALAGRLPRRAMRWIGGILIALFALAPPLLSLDVFSYIAYARLGSHGLNPYQFAPDSIPADAAAGRVEDFRTAVSVYGPLFTLGSIPLGSLGVPVALWSLKAVAALSVAGIAALSARLAAVRGVDPGRAAAFVALNPLVLVHLVGGAHNDGLMVLLAMLSIAAALSSRPLLAGVGLVGAASIKVSGALYAPFAVVGSEMRGRLLAGIALAAGVVAAAALVGFGPDALEALSVAGGNQATVSHWSVPATLARITSLDVDAAACGLRRALRARRARPALPRLAGGRLGLGRRVGGLRPARRHRLHGPLVSDLAPAAGGDLPRSGPDRAHGPAHLLPGRQRGARVSGGSDPRRDEPLMRSSPEFDLLAAIRRRMGATRTSHEGAAVAVGIGDDAAVTIPGGAIAVSVDALVEGVGFRREWCPPLAVGRKAMGAALSDLAAMGARAGEAYVWVGAPREFGDADCLELADGIAAQASEHGVAVLGGDLTAAGELSVCVTAIGHARLADDLVGREGAEPGFSLCVTGALGGAAAGLMVLEHAELGAEVGESARDAVISRQLAPVPRLAAGIALAGSGARAMIDVSDGLGADAEHLAAASGLGIEIELDLVPVGDGVREVATCCRPRPQ